MMVGDIEFDLEIGDSIASRLGDWDWGHLLHNLKLGSFKTRVSCNYAALLYKMMQPHVLCS